MSANEQPALAVSVNIVTALGDGRQMNISSYFAQDDDPEQVNNLLDRLHSFADRQKAKYDLDGLRLELKKHEDTLAQFLEDLDTVEGRHAKEQASREVEILTILAAKDDILTNDRALREATGRAGEYAPRGHVKASLDRHDQAASRVKADIEKAEAERAQAVQNLQKSIDRYNAAIGALKADIKKNEALVG
jgi:hypothetical protein